MRQGAVTKALLLGTLCLPLLQTSCTPEFEAEYVDPHSLKLIDDRWTQTDIDRIGELVKDLNMKVARSPKRFGSNPTVIFKEIENRTDEHIDTVPIKNKIVDELTNADSFMFVDAEARADIAKEMDYQHKSGNVDPTTSAEQGRQTGAQFFLRGTISSTVNTQGGRKILTYQINLKLTNIQGGTILWSKQYYTSKDMKRSSGKW